MVGIDAFSSPYFFHPGEPKLAVEGPGGVQASFDFRGAKNDAAGLDPNGHARQRPRRNGLRMMHKVLLRLTPSSVDVRP